MDALGTLDDLVQLVDRDHHRTLYVRWTFDVQRDLDTGVSRDELTGVRLPGLSVNPLAPEDWWQDRELRVWVACRLYDYRHLADKRGDGTRPWVLSGEVAGRGPDNEPLISGSSLIAALRDAVIQQAVRLIDGLPADWGSLRRT